MTGKNPLDVIAEKGTAEVYGVLASYAKTGTFPDGSGSNGIHPGLTFYTHFAGHNDEERLPASQLSQETIVPVASRLFDTILSETLNPDYLGRLLFLMDKIGLNVTQSTMNKAASKVTDGMVHKDYFLCETPITSMIESVAEANGLEYVPESSE